MGKMNLGEDKRGRRMTEAFVDYKRYRMVTPAITNTRHEIRQRYAQKKLGWKLKIEQYKNKRLRKELKDAQCVATISSNTGGFLS